MNAHVQSQTARLHRPLVRSGMALLGIALLQFSLRAQVTWDGGGGNNRWATANNWNPNGVPGAGTDVLLDNSDVATLPTTIQLRGDRMANSLTFDTGDLLSLINGLGSRTLTLTSGNLTRTAASSGSQGLAFTTLALAANGSFDIAGSGDFTISSVLANSGGARSVTKTGAGLLILSGNNTFSGGLTVNTGTVGFGHDNAAGSGTLTLAGGAIQAAGAARTLANAVTVTGDFSVTGTQNLTLSGGLQLNGNYTFAVDNTATTTFAGVVDDLYYAGFTKTGAGTLVLSGANTFQGTVAVDTGTLRLTNNSALGSSTWGNTVAAGATLELNHGTGLTITEGSFEIAGSGAGGAGALYSSGGANAVNANITLTADSLIRVGAGKLVLNNQISGTDRTLTIDGAGNLTATNQVGLGTGGSLSVAAAGTSTFTGNITAGGGIDITGGGATLFTGGAVNLGAGLITIDSAGNQTFSTVINSTGGLTKAGTGTTTLAGGSNNSLSGPVIVNAGTLVLGKSAGVNALTGALVIGDDTGTDTVRLTAANQIADSAPAVTINRSGVLDLNNFDETMAGLTLTGGAVTTGTGTLTLTNAAAITTNAADNAATVAGRLALTPYNATVSVADGAAASDLVISAILSGSSILTKTGAGTLELAGANTFVGNLNLNEGMLRVAADANLGNTANDLNFAGGTLQAAGTFTANAGRVFTVGAGGGTVDVTSGQTLTLATAGQLAGSGVLTRTGAGTLAITAANTGYTGDTSLNDGVTRLGAYNALGTGTAATVTLNNGAELEAAFANATNFQSNLLINDGIIRRTNSTGTKTGFQNNNAASTLTVAGTAQIIDQDGVGGTGGFLTLDGVVQLNAGASLTATAVNANDEVRFGGAQKIELAAGSTLTTGGAGRVSFGSGAARTIIGQGTTANEATLALGAANHVSNANSRFQVDGSGTGGLRIEGTQARVDAFVTDARLAATTGSGGALTLAYTDAGSRTLGAAANLTTASGVLLALETNGGNFTLGTGSGDLDNWGGLVVKGANTTVTFGADQVFAPGASLTLEGGTLALGGTDQSFASLNITGNSVIDFAGGGSTLNLDWLNIAPGITLTITNWLDTMDYLIASNFAGAVYDTWNSTPMSQIIFQPYDGADTRWQSYDNQITPIPEPSTYGALVAGLGLALWFWRRRGLKSAASH